MVSAATVFTQENLRFIQGFMNLQLRDLMSQAIDGAELFLMQEREVVGVQFAERRKHVTRVTRTNGTIITMPANGVPNGTKYSDGDSLEEAIDVTVKVGEFQVLEDDVLKLQAALSGIDLGVDSGRTEGYRIMMDQGWGDYIRENMYRDLIAKEKDELFAVLNALKTTTIYGTDFVVANSGTLFGGDNLAAQAFGADIQDVILTRLRDMETLKGYKVGFSMPKYFFTTAANLPDALRIFSPNQTINVDHQNLFNYFQGAGQTFVDNPEDLSGNYSVAISGNHGIRVLYETAEPRFIMNTDEYGNLTMLLKRASGIGVVARQGIVQIDHA